MVVVCGAEDEVGGEGEVVDPVGVGGEGVSEGAVGGVPHFDGLVVRGGVDEPRTAPAHARDGAFVPAEHRFDALGDDVPDADCGVFGCGR